MLNLHPQKIAIGSTKLGLAYGAVSQEKVPNKTALDILRHMRSMGFDMIDTAPSYGNAQQLIGEAFHSDVGNETSLKIVTTLSAIQTDSINSADIEKVHKDFLDSLQKMNMSSIYAVLIHNSADLLKKGSDQLANLLQLLKSDGLVKKIGVSVYTPEETNIFYNRYDFDLIQFPLNIFDQRFLRSKSLDWLAEKQVEIHARSVFLKGVLLKPEIKDGLPLSLLKQNAKFHAFLQKNNINAYEACMNFVMEQTLVDRWVIGVSKTEQIDNMIKFISNGSSINSDLFEFESWSLTSDAALDPRCW